MAQRRLSGVAARASGVQHAAARRARGTLSGHRRRCRTRTPTPPPPSGSRNGTHLQCRGAVAHATCCTPSSRTRTTSIAIALDDDQGAYLDNDTWPAPHWHAYVDWLRRTVAVGRRQPSSALHQHVRDEACRARRRRGRGATGTKATRIASARTISPISISRPDCCRRSARLPVMQSEFQAGWLQSCRRRRAAAERSVEHGARARRAAARRRARHRELPGAGHDLSARLGGAVGELVLRLGCGAHRRSARLAALRADARFRRSRSRATERCSRRTHVAADASIVWPREPFCAGQPEQRRFHGARRRDDRDAARVQRTRSELHARRSRSTDERSPRVRRRFFFRCCPSVTVDGTHAPSARFAAACVAHDRGRLVSDPSSVRARARPRSLRT